MTLLAASPPRSVIFDVMLIAHVAVVVVSLVVFATMYAAAMSIGRASEGASWPDSARRYFFSPREVAGRTIYLIPLTGLLLLASSQHRFGFGDGFVGIGIAAWLTMVVVAEVLVFPDAAALGRLVRQDKSATALEEARRLAGRVRWGVDGILLLLVFGSVIMVAQP
jgi:hypothetical protein